MKNKFVWLLGLILAAFLWWTISPLFITVTVNDELPPEILSGESNTSELAPGETPTTFTEGPFPIVDTPTHPATGSIRLVRSPEETIVRFEDYNGTNGPDLRIYLATDLEATEFIDLGEARGNQGNINYSVPSDVDIDEYRYVMTWCRAFGVLFDYAEIN